MLVLLNPLRDGRCPTAGNLFHDQAGALHASRLVWIRPQPTARPLPSFVGPLELPLLIPYIPVGPPPAVTDRQLLVGYAGQLPGCAHAQFLYVKCLLSPSSFPETKGRRITMEDTIVIKRNFRGYADEDLFAVFDGHGGLVAVFHGNFLDVRRSCLAYRAGCCRICCGETAHHLGPSP